MKKKKVLPWFSFALLLLVMSGCISTAIEKRFPERWEKTYIGMSLDEFTQVWPDADYAGSGLDNTEIYSYAPPGVYTLNPRIEFFIFRDAELINYYEQ
jgi:hypothetical protein